MVIDWSKAPEGANGYVADEGVWPALWYRRNGEELHWTHVNGPVKWEQSTGIRENIIWRDEQPPAWAGEGLPPVGTVCEARVPFGVNEVFVWRKVVVAFDRQNGHDVLVFDAETYRPGWADELRPIKTPEQIAAEERDKAVHQMGLDAGFSGSVQQCYERLYDLGYRKTEGGAA